VYTYRSSNTLLGAHIDTFQTQHYQFGIRFSHRIDSIELLFNSRNADDRNKFVDDVREAIAECNEMESIRIDMEIDRQQHKFAVGNRAERDSGLPDEATMQQQQQQQGAARRHSINSLDSGMVSIFLLIQSYPLLLAVINSISW
jgi:hypothetical protein